MQDLKGLPFIIICFATVNCVALKTSSATTVAAATATTNYKLTMNSTHFD